MWAYVVKLVDQFNVLGLINRTLWVLLLLGGDEVGVLLVRAQQL